VCRTGYTGERGFELLVPGEVAPALWEELFERGAPFEVTPVGLGGRATLRLEMGHAPHGDGISTDTDPSAARAGRGPPRGPWRPRPPAAGDGLRPARQRHPHRHRPVRGPPRLGRGHGQGR